MRVDDNFPQPLPWEQRAKGTNPMPGGYSGYLDSLGKICRRVVERAPAFEELVVWMGDEFGISETSSGLRLRFLETAGLTYRSDGIVRLGEETRSWLENREDKLLIAVLHKHVRFVGEMLWELKEPKSIEKLREIAADYGLDWERHTQVNNRRGWLESAKLIIGSSQRLELTTAGQDLLTQLAIFDPLKKQRATQDDEVSQDSSPCVHEPEGDGKQTRRPRSASNAELLSSEILAASTDSDEPQRFERAVRDGFMYMGFIAEHLGGSGKTDVLLTAALGKDDRSPGSNRCKDD